MKKCIKCNVEKAIAEFTIRSNKKTRGECKTCSALISKKYREDNRGKMKLYEAKWNYGISLDEADNLYKETNCQICGKEFTHTKHKHIDHCHDTGEVRGVLCIRCNFGIGYFKDNVDIISNAIKYLNKGTLPIAIPMKM